MRHNSSSITDSECKIQNKIVGTTIYGNLIVVPFCHVYKFSHHSANSQDFFDTNITIFYILIWIFFIMFDVTVNRVTYFSVDVPYSILDLNHNTHVHKY